VSGHAGAVSIASFTGWDWFVALALSLSVLLGAWRGMVRTVFGLAAWIAALVGTPLLAPDVLAATGLREAPWVVYATLFLVLLIGVRLLGGLLASLLGKAGLGGADRSLGAVLGAARAAIVIVLVVAGARMLDMHEDPEWRDALSRPLLDAVVVWIEPYLPQRYSGIRET
jgi:membrane protein required for colicin V production